MYVIVWEFEVAPGREEEFKRAYGPAGDWARLFERGEGYIGTTLLASPPGARRDGEGRSRRFLTLDRWTSEDAHVEFRARHGTEYAALDERLEALTARETPLGSFVEVS